MEKKEQNCVFRVFFLESVVVEKVCSNLFNSSQSQRWYHFLLGLNNISAWSTPLGVTPSSCPNRLKENKEGIGALQTFWKVSLIIKIYCLPFFAMSVLCTLYLKEWTPCFLVLFFTLTISVCLFLILYHILTIFFLTEDSDSTKLPHSSVFPQLLSTSQLLIVTRHLIASVGFILHYCACDFICKHLLSSEQF